MSKNLSRLILGMNLNLNFSTGVKTNLNSLIRDDDLKGSNWFDSEYGRAVYNRKLEDSKVDVVVVVVVWFVCFLLVLFVCFLFFVVVFFYFFLFLFCFVCFVFCFVLVFFLFFFLFLFVCCFFFFFVFFFFFLGGGGCQLCIRSFKWVAGGIQLVHDVFKEIGQATVKL